MVPTAFDPGKVLTPTGRAMLDMFIEQPAATVEGYKDEVRAAVQQALAMIAALEAENALLKRNHTTDLEWIRVCTDASVRMEAENERLREVIEPFAKAISEVETLPDGRHIDWTDEENFAFTTDLTVGDLRRARAALEGK